MKRKKCKHCRTAPRLRLKELCGVCEVLDAGAVPGGHAPSGWPMASRAAGVSTDRDLAAARAVDASAGVHTEYDAKRRPIFRDRGHRKQYLRAHQMHDNDGGYGD